jgi:hypothetical protein
VNALRILAFMEICIQLELVRSFPKAFKKKVINL